MSEKARIKIHEEKEQEQAEDQQSVESSPLNADEGRNVGADEIPTPREGEDLSARLEEAEQKSQDYYDRLLRVSAEFDNFKKRSNREMRDLVKYANEKLIKELLSVIDNLERAIDAATKDGHENDPLLQGVCLTLGEVLKILERHDVKPIDSLGKPFDPTFHQAVLQEESDEQPPNTVIRELQKGYLIHDRLLRPAMVGVSKAMGIQPENQ